MCFQHLVVVLPQLTTCFFKWTWFYLIYCFGFPSRSSFWKCWPNGSLLYSFVLRLVSGTGSDTTMSETLPPASLHGRLQRTTEEDEGQPRTSRTHRTTRPPGEYQQNQIYYMNELRHLDDCHFVFKESRHLANVCTTTCGCIGMMLFRYLSRLGATICDVTIWFVSVYVCRVCDALVASCPTVHYASMNQNGRRTLNVQVA